MTNKLDELYAHYINIESMQLAAQTEREAILASVKDALDAVDAKYADALKAEHDACFALDTEIKADVLANGATMKGSHLMAVYSEGRVSWDTKAPDWYAAAHPELQTFRKTGEPTVTIRKI